MSKSDRDRWPSGAVAGWTAFAAVVMLLSGGWSVLEGLAVLIKSQFFAQHPDYAYDVPSTGWGWWHLILGLVMVAAGACLIFDMLWARTAGVTLAAFSAVTNFLSVPYSPAWSVVIIALDVLVIWALTVPRPSHR
jgi:hypothetical protein